LIADRKAQDALQTLKYTQKRAAKHIRKSVAQRDCQSGAQSGRRGAPLDVDELFVANCFVNGGRAGNGCVRRDGPRVSLQKRTAHLWVGGRDHVAAAQRVAPSKRKPKHKRACAHARRVRKALTRKQAPREGKKYGTEDASVRIQA